MKTSLITLISSDHGRLRREQRDIQKRDLQKALKYGRRSLVWGGRWKVEYDGITFIVNKKQNQEITCYPSPLSTAPVDFHSELAHMNAKRLVDFKPELAVTHTVLVIDNSGSMTEHDMDLYRCRQTAAYTMVALEYVAEQLFNKTANNSDVVSLVEFNEQAEIVFSREPVSWVLFNKLLARRDERSFKAREHEKVLDMIGNQSNYLPALDHVDELFNKGKHDDCALSLLFVSDGAPTDSSSMGLTPAAARQRICQKIQVIAMNHNDRDRLSMIMIGFGSVLRDFAVLEEMATTAQATIGDRSKFVYCDKMVNSIGTGVSSLVSTTTATRTALMAFGRGTKRTFSSEAQAFTKSEWSYFPILYHNVYDLQAKDFVHYPGLPPGCLRPDLASQTEAQTWSRNPPKLLALNRLTLGEGAERAAFRCRLALGSDNFVLGEMVAKETNTIERIEENIDFHRSFLEGQDLAAYLAGEFNSRLKALWDYNRVTTPTITFVPCSVLVVQDPEWDGGRSPRGLLVEQLLDTEKYGWCKWNDNAGGIDGRAAHLSIDIEHEIDLMNGNLNEGLGDIAEDEEEEESDDEDAMFDDGIEEKVDDSPDFGDNGTSYEPSEFLQAFSHFSYLFTSKKVLICDLQGIYIHDGKPPTFMLTDPAIHYRSNRGRRNVFGRTDKGQRGIQLFFNTHKCSEVCKLMKLSKKNKEWTKEWKRSSTHPSG